MKTGLVNTSYADDSPCCFLLPSEGTGGFFLVCSCRMLSVFLFLFMGHSSAFPLWSEGTGVALLAWRCLSAEQPCCCRHHGSTCVWGEGCWVLMLITQPCVIRWMAVTNLCVGSILIMENDYSFPSSVSSALF